MSVAFEHFSDVKIIECDDFLSVLPSLVPAGNILLVTSKGFTQRGLVAQVVAKCGASRVYVFDDVTPNPEKSHLQTNITQYIHHNIDHVIALGGGSVIDAAKVFSALLAIKNFSLCAKMDRYYEVIQNPLGAGISQTLRKAFTVKSAKEGPRHEKNVKLT